MVSGSQSALAALIEERCDAIVHRFVDRARAVGASKRLPEEEIIDSLREYLLELAERIEGEVSAQSRPATTQSVATSHGQQRFEHGYDLPALVREYSALADLIGEEVAEHAPEISFAELRIMNRFLIYSIADAAGRYTALRDAELRRQTAEHIAFLAHEVRNPLSSATMAVSLLRSRNEVKPSLAFDALERAVRKAAHVTNDALLTVRLREVGTLDRAAIDMHELLEEIARDSETDAAAKGVALKVEASGSIIADGKALRSAISNLVRNAVKFSRANGTVHAHARPADGRVIVEITDSCGGLPEGSERKLFDPFVQVGKDRSGFGLGLAIAKQVADAHDGQLRVHNLPGEGCVFILDLPAIPAEPSRTDLEQ